MNNKIIVGGIVAVLFIVAVGAFLFSGSGSSKVEAGEYDTFAQCLYDSGMRMYGSATCSFCEKQRKLFGASERFVREIECDPRNELSQTELCIARDITHTPTWILEDSDGNDINRLDSGVKSLEELSKVSGCPLEKDPISEDST